MYTLNSLICHELEALANTLAGTCDSIDAGLERIDLEPGDYDTTNVQDDLIGLNTELCIGCQWWFESCELDPDAYCEDCQE